MRIQLSVPVEIVQGEGTHTFRREVLSREIVFIRRTPANRKKTAFYYQAHYIPESDEIEAYNKSYEEDRLRVANIDRKINKFNPKDFNFLNNLAMVKKK